MHKCLGTQSCTSHKEHSTASKPMESTPCHQRVLPFHFWAAQSANSSIPWLTRPTLTDQNILSHTLEAPDPHPLTGSLGILRLRGYSRTCRLAGQGSHLHQNTSFPPSPVFLLIHVHFPFTKGFITSYRKHLTGELRNVTERSPGKDSFPRSPF